MGKRAAIYLRVSTDEQTPENQERALREVPTLALLAASQRDLRDRAGVIHRALEQDGIGSEVVSSTGSVGAGAFPNAALPGAAVALAGDAERWASHLRAGEPAVVGRVHDGRMQLDLRAVLPRELPELARATVAARD